MVLPLSAAVLVLSGCAGVLDADERDADGGSLDADADALPEPDAAPGCAFAADAPLLLNYASAGSEDNLRFLPDDCAYEVVVGDKRDAPGGAVSRPEARARGARSGYVMDQHGTEIRTMLRERGVEATAARLRRWLDAGYDYIVIDEITADPEWADGSEVGTRFRRLLDALPPRTVIAYVSLDLTMRDGGGARLRERKWLMRAMQRRGRALALEVYLHTGEVMAGRAPAAFQAAATRLSDAVAGLEDAERINASALTVLGLSMNTPYPQYNYLDAPASDLRAIDRQLEALTSGPRLGQQRGLGYYFVNRSDITPAADAPYDVDRLIGHLADGAEGHLTR